MSKALIGQGFGFAEWMIMELNLPRGSVLNNSCALSVIKALGNALPAAKLGDAGLAAQAVQNDPDLLFRRMTFAGCPADVLYEPLRR